MSRNRLLFSFCLVFFSILATAQQVKFYASTDAKEMVDGGYVDVSFTLENAEGSNFQAPSFKGFRVVSGPSQSSQISIVNGRRSQKMSYGYTLLAEGVGTKRIGAASIVVRKEKYNTQPISIKVVKPSKRQAAEADSPIFIRLEQSDSTVYKGQQLTLKYVLYTTKDINSADFRSEETFDGFFVSRIRNFRDRAQRVVIDGVQYTKKTLKTYALFPQRTGTFDFAPVPVTLGIPLNNERSGFFFSTRVRRENISAEGGQVTVLPTPENAPISYSGAVGSFTIQTGIDKRSITTDDAITMRMQISGNGDSKFLIAPTQPESSDWEVYDPNVLNEETIERGDAIMTVKNYEYLMVPKRKGRLAIKPEFTYFDPDSAKYITLYGNPTAVNVVQGAGDSTLEDALEQEELSLAPNISTTSFSQKGKYFMFSPGYWACMSFPFLGLIGILFYKRKLINEGNVDQDLKRESEAEKIAKERLVKAEAFMNQSESKAFYGEVNDALYGYVSDKLRIPAADLSRSNIQNRLLEKNVASENVESFASLLDKVQMSLYAGGDTDMKSLYDESVKAIADIDSFLK